VGARKCAVQEWAKNPLVHTNEQVFKKKVAKRDKNSTLGVVNPYNVVGVTNPCTKRGIKGQKRETKQDCNVAPLKCMYFTVQTSTTFGTAFLHLLTCRISAIT